MGKFSKVCAAISNRQKLSFIVELDNIGDICILSIGSIRVKQGG